MSYSSAYPEFASESFGQLIDGSLNEVYVFDAETLKFIHVNRGARENLGYTKEEMADMTPLSIKPTIDEQIFEQIIAPLREESTKQIKFYIEHQRKDGSFYPVEVHLQMMTLQERPVFVAFILDITERRQMEEEREALEHELFKAKRLETVGQLAGGIAHDLNNMLTPVMGYTEMVLEAISDPVLKRDLEQVKKAATRAKGLVEQILVFSGKTDRRQEPLSVRKIVREVLQLLQQVIPENVHIDCQCSSDDRTGILGDPTQIHQVFLNLITNACDALKAEGGTVTIRFNYDDAITSEEHQASAESWLHVIVSDNGPGIPSGIMDRVFEPFYSTKKRHEGSGLGLSVAKGIVANHGGSLEVQSEPGKGATFHIYLPRINDMEELVDETEGPIIGGSERILLVDDEEPILHVTQRILSQLGYHVTPCSSPIDALGKFRTAPDSFDLVITDQMMPEMTGDRFLEELRAIREDIPVLVITGFSADISADDFIAKGAAGFLAKPIQLRDLASSIRGVLEA